MFFEAFWFWHEKRTKRVPCSQILLEINLVARGVYKVNFEALRFWHEKRTKLVPYSQMVLETFLVARGGLQSEF